MRIAIDARELCGHPTGVGRYLGEIVREWDALPAAWIHEFLFFAPDTFVLPPARNLLADVRVLPGGGLWWEQLVLPRLARDAGADVLFAPGYSGPICGRVPVVVAIHDVSFGAHPEWFRWREGLRRRLVTRAVAHEAARVVTISEFSRREIHEYLGVPLQRIEVIPPGVRRRIPNPESPIPNPQSRIPSLLYVGSLFNRRHIPELIQGFARLARRHPDARLDIIGENRTFPFQDIERIRERTGVGDRIHLLSYVSDAVLADLYARAKAFAFLSEYEGFGLTPADALAAGIPIVVLDTAVAREVYGDAAVYVAAPEPVLVDQAFEQVLFDEAVRERVLRAAALILPRYSWRRCAERVLGVLLEATNPEPRPN